MPSAGLVIMGSSVLGACLRARIGPRLPTLVAFAATPRNDISQIVSAVIVGDLHTWPDGLKGAYDDIVAYYVCLGIGPARMICVSSKILSARSVNRPSAVDLVKVAVPSGFKFIGLLVRELATFVFDNEGALLDRRCREKAQTGAGTADTESSLAGHYRMYGDSRRRGRYAQHGGGKVAADTTRVESVAGTLLHTTWRRRTNVWRVRQGPGQAAQLSQNGTTHDRVGRHLLQGAAYELRYIRCEHHRRPAQGD